MEQPYPYTHTQLTNSSEPLQRQHCYIYQVLQLPHTFQQQHHHRQDGLLHISSRRHDHYYRHIPDVSRTTCCFERYERRREAAEINFHGIAACRREANRLLVPTARRTKIRLDQVPPRSQRSEGQASESLHHRCRERQ